MFSLRLKNMRKRAGFKTQDDAARALNIKPRRYASLERGEVSLTLEDAYKISEVFRCTPNDLCGMDARTVDMSKEQEDLNRCYEAMNERGRNTLLESAKIMSKSRLAVSEKIEISEIPVLTTRLVHTLKDPELLALDAGSKVTIEA